MTKVASLAVGFLVFAAVPLPVAAAVDDPCALPPESRPPASEPITACGSTVVTGTNGTAIRLILPEDATLDATSLGSRFRSITIQGSGPMIGYVLTDNDIFTDGGRFVYGFYLGPGYFAEQRAWGSGTFPRAGGDPAVYNIPAGTYSLYLLSSGGAVTLTLPFIGRPGSVSILPNRKVDASVEPLYNRFPDPIGVDAHNLFYGGKSANLRGGGMLILAAASPSAGLWLGDIGATCYYEYIPSNEDLAYMPGCPSFLLENSNGTIWTEGVGGGFITTFHRAGGAAIGFWHATATPGWRLGAVGASLVFDEE